MSKELVFGHQKPDTDAITAAMAFSYFQNQLGYETEAVALGEPNDETKFALKTFGMEAPRVIETAANEVDKVMLVDHNEPQQSVSDIDKVTVTHLVDHHRIAGFETAQPLWATVRPYGCVSTIITELFQEKQVNKEKIVECLCEYTNPLAILDISRSQRICPWIALVSATF